MANKWLPISRLPKDVHVFIGYVPKPEDGGRGGFFVCVRHPDGEISVPVPRRSDEDSDTYFTCKPTHWHSLPAKPRLSTDLFAVEGPYVDDLTKETKGWIISRPIAGGPDLFYLMTETSAEAEEVCREYNRNFRPNAESD